MSQSRHRTSLGVTGCRKEIAKDRERSQECREMSQDCRDVVACRARSLEFTKRQESRRLRSTLRHYNRIPPDWGVPRFRLRSAVVPWYGYTWKVPCWNQHAAQSASARLFATCTSQRPFAMLPPTLDLDAEAAGPREPQSIRNKITRTIVVQNASASTLWAATYKALNVATGELVLGDMRMSAMKSELNFPVMQCRSSSIIPAGQISDATIVCGFTDVGSGSIASFELILMGQPEGAAELSQRLFARFADAVATVPGAVAEVKRAASPIDQPSAGREGRVVS